MAQHAPFLPGLSPVRGKPVHATFDDGRLTSERQDSGRPEARQARQARELGAVRADAQRAALRAASRPARGEDRSMTGIVRLTATQALVRYLAAQRTIIDGREEPL